VPRPKTRLDIQGLHNPQKIAAVAESKVENADTLMSFALVKPSPIFVFIAPHAFSKEDMMYQELSVFIYRQTVDINTM
jgi:hypothetical protein